MSCELWELFNFANVLTTAVVVSIFHSPSLVPFFSFPGLCFGRG